MMMMMMMMMIMEDDDYDDDDEDDDDDEFDDDDYDDEDDDKVESLPAVCVLPRDLVAPPQGESTCGCFVFRFSLFLVLTIKYF